jgi:hypothetical protein
MRHDPFTCGKRRECIIGWRKHRERHDAFQRLYEACGLDRHYKRVWSAELAALSTISMVGYFSLAVNAPIATSHKPAMTTFKIFLFMTVSPRAMLDCRA